MTFEVDIDVEETDDLADAFAAGMALVEGGPQVPTRNLPLATPRDITNAIAPLDTGDEDAVKQRIKDIFEISKDLARLSNTVLGWKISLYGFIDEHMLYAYFGAETGHHDIVDMRSYAYAVGDNPDEVIAAVKSYRKLHPMLEHLGYEPDQIEEVFNSERLNTQNLKYLEGAATRLEHATGNYQQELEEQEVERVSDWIDNLMTGATNKPLTSTVESQHSSDVRPATLAFHISEIGTGESNKVSVFGTFAFSKNELEAILGRKFSIMFIDNKGAELPVSIVISHVDEITLKKLQRKQR